MSDTEEKTLWSYKTWYEKNGSELAERRRHRYANDPDYKDRVLEQNRKYRSKKVKERGDKPTIKVRVPKTRKPIEGTVQVHGVPTELELVHVGTFARQIGRSVPTIHQWERSGILPKTPFSLVGNDKQERLYTRNMIQVVRQALDKRSGTISSSDKSFTAEVLDGWKAAGLNTDELATFKMGKKND